MKTTTVVEKIREIKSEVNNSEKGHLATLITVEENGMALDLVLQHLETSNRPSLRLEFCINGSVVETKRFSINKFNHLTEIINHMENTFEKLVKETEKTRALYK